MSRRPILTILLAWLCCVAPALAASEGAQATHDHLPPYAEVLVRIGPFPITNSMVMIWLVAGVIILVAQMATRNLKLIPSGLQNFVEWLVETLYNFFEGVLGKHLVQRTFWFFGTIFILILFCNWSGLIPGLGTIGWEVTHADGPRAGLPYIDAAGHRDGFRPFLRGANADLNLTMAMAVSFFFLWFYWAITEIGLKNLLAHIFAPKGKFTGLMRVAMIVIFFMVGLIEALSIAVRPIALMFRLYGNVFAGENMLERTALLVPKWLAWLPPLPFYFLELLVGIVQALVFSLLTAVFLKLICTHDEEHDEHEHDEHEKDRAH